MTHARARAAVARSRASDVHRVATTPCASHRREMSSSSRARSGVNVVVVVEVVVEVVVVVASSSSRHIAPTPRRSVPRGRRYQHVSGSSDDDDEARDASSSSSSSSDPSDDDGEGARRRISRDDAPAKSSRVAVCPAIPPSASSAPLRATRCIDGRGCSRERLATARRHRVAAALAPLRRRARRLHGGRE
jgi:hypothetical protein